MNYYPANTKIYPLIFLILHLSNCSLMGLEEEEMLENEQLWSEEKDKMEDAGVSGDQLRQVGVSPGDIEADIDTADAVGVDAAAGEADAEAGADVDVEAGTEET